MMRRTNLATFVSVALALAAPAGAWQPETRIRMTDEAVRMMPESLRLALESHRSDLLRGMLEPLVDEDGREHGADVGASVELGLGELAATLARPADFAAIAGRFGRVAHFVADAGFPPGVGPAGGAHYTHFADFCETRRERFPLVFYGHDDPQLDGGDVGGFTRRMVDAARDDDLRLARAYAEAGSPPDPAHFDDRSVPFAVGSLAYSRTVTDMVRVWLAAWRDAGGDLGSTPYWRLSNEGVGSD